MMLADPILTTLQRAIGLQGGVTEETGAHTLHALLPDTLAQTLRVPSELTLSTRAGESGAHFISYDSPLLSGFERIFTRNGSLAALRVAYQGYIKKSGFEQSALAALTLHNGIMRVLDVSPRESVYFLCTTAYTAESEDKRQGKISFTINAVTGAAPVDIGDALLWEADQTELIKLPLSGTVASSVLEAAIIANSSRLIIAELEPWSQRLERRLKSDEERLRSYYGAIIDEIQRRADKKGLIGEDRAREQARSEATHRELERKEAEVRARHALRVNASLHSLLALLLPTVHVHCELIKKRRRREITMVWNPFTKAIEPLRCERGNEPTTHVSLEDDDRLVCPRCHEQSAGRIV